MFIFMEISDKAILLRKVCSHSVFWLQCNGNPFSGLICADESVAQSGWDGFAHLLLVSCSNWLIQVSLQIVRKETTAVRQLNDSSSLTSSLQQREMAGNRAEIR